MRLQMLFLVLKTNSFAASPLPLIRLQCLMCLEAGCEVVSGSKPRECHFLLLVVRTVLDFLVRAESKTSVLWEYLIKVKVAKDLDIPLDDGEQPSWV